MTSKNQTARIVGVLYLIVAITGFYYLRYVPTKLIDPNNPAVTFKNIMGSQPLFRLGILAGLVGYTVFFFVPLVLYKLLSPVNKTHAQLMAILGVISVPISYVNMLNNFDILTLISNPDYLHIFGADKLQAQVMLHLDYYDSGNLIASIFWGLWLFPFGYLVFRSGFLPKVLGILLMFGCFGYLINFIGYLVFPQYDKTLIARFITMPGSVGELGTCLWLLIMGAKDKTPST
jgi:Domain of unknown function (DUF4386)